MKVITDVMWSSLTAIILTNLLEMWCIYQSACVLIGCQWAIRAEVPAHNRTSEAEQQAKFVQCQPFNVDGWACCPCTCNAHNTSEQKNPRRIRNGVTDSLKRLRQQTSCLANNSSTSESWLSIEASLLEHCRLKKWYTRWPCRWTQPVVDESWGTLCWSWSLIRHLLSFFLSVMRYRRENKYFFLLVATFGEDAVG